MHPKATLLHSLSQKLISKVQRFSPPIPAESQLPPSSPSAIIFGGGLAGSILAERFVEAGHEILLVDNPGKSRCSRIAAGLVNPIGGKRLKLIWQAAALIPFARTYYRNLELKYSRQIFHPRNIVRYFSNEQEEKLWQKRILDPEYREWVGLSKDTHFTIPSSGYLDTSSLLDLLHAHLESRNALLSSSFEYDEVELTETGVRFREYHAPIAIFAEGHFATQNPYFQFVPYKPAKGIIATIKIDNQNSTGITRDHANSTDIIVKGKFIIPRHDGTIQVGATYNWDDPTDEPDEEGIQELKQFLDRELGVDTWQFDGIQAGVRPATAGAYPVVGRHPEHQQLIAFNGFGSKGSLQVPYFADALISNLLNSTPLPQEVLPSRFIKKSDKKAKRWIATDIVKEVVLKTIEPADFAIDATAGNGHDTQWLAEATGPDGHVFAYDIQEEALKTTRLRLDKYGLAARVTLIHSGHENFLDTIPPAYHGKIAAIVFNLGFLPGGDTSLITQADTTSLALKTSLKILKPGGILSVTLYPSHPGARDEVDLVLSWFNHIPEDQFEKRIEKHPQGNTSSPYPLFIRKR